MVPIKTKSKVREQRWILSPSVGIRPNPQYFQMGIGWIRWHVYVTEQVVKSVNQIKQVNNLQSVDYFNMIYYELDKHPNL